MKYGNLLLLIVVCSVLAIASSKDLNPKVHRAPLRPSKLLALRKAQMKKKRVVAKKRLHVENTVDPGNQQSNSKKQPYGTPGNSCAIVGADTWEKFQDMADKMDEHVVLHIPVLLLQIIIYMSG